MKPRTDSTRRAGDLIAAHAPRPSAKPASSRPPESQDVLAHAALAMPRLSVHKLAPPRQCVRSTVGLFGLVADDMGKRVFGQLARERRLVAGPIAK